MAISSSVISRSKCFCTDSKVKGKLTRYFVWTIFVLRDSDVCEGVTDLSILGAEMSVRHGLRLASAVGNGPRNATLLALANYGQK